MNPSLSQEELNAFNEEFLALQEKHGVTITIGQQLMVNKKPVENLPDMASERSTSPEMTSTPKETIIEPSGTEIPKK